MNDDESRSATSTTVVFGASVIGPLHVKLGLPCQDAWRAEVQGDGTIIIAVADGLGSASRSDSGARLAVDSAVDAVQLQLGASGAAEGAEELSAAVLVGVEEARRELERLAEDSNWELRDVACTLIVAVARPSGYAVAHVGDGAVIADTESGLALISDPGDSEYANEVTPLTSPKWGNAVRKSDYSGPVRILAVFTDGCQRAALKKDRTGTFPFGGFWNPLLGYASTVSSAEEAGEDIRRLLASDRMADNSEDDKTLVFGVFRP